ncbi:MAG: coenzyme F420-0:L-glutamate ligase [Pseudomonadota bacterium]|nr:coenzyme F420-0:L-glutamate ligase [Pseudomonadota bacterium]
MSPIIDQLTMISLPDIPVVEYGDDLADMVIQSVGGLGTELVEGDVLVVAQKIISKSEGREVSLHNIVPSSTASELAKIVDKDPRLIEVILDESKEVVRYRSGLIIVENKNGLVLANAGVDMSNVRQTEGDTVLLLPNNPDESAACLRDEVMRRTGIRVGVIVNDSLGRAFRNGTTGTAIGVAGLPALTDLSGKSDLFGRKLQVTQVGVADELAAGASLLMGQAAEGRPIVLVRGFISGHPAGSARELVREKEQDLFRDAKP